MKFVIYTFAFLSSLFTIFVLFLLLLLNINGDQWLKDGLQSEIRGQFGVNARIESAQFSLIKPGIEIQGFYAPIHYPPLKLRFEKFRIAFDFQLLNLFDADKEVLDMTLELKEPRMSFGAHGNEDEASAEKPIQDGEQ